MNKVSVNEIIQVPGEDLELLKEAVKQEINCARPGIVQDFNPVDQTVTVELAIRSVMNGKSIKPPVLTDVPVFFPGGKDSGITFPIEKGDECLVVFADCCIDAWFQSGNASIPISVRKHDLSDGFAFVGFRSRKNSLPDISKSYAFGKQEVIDLIYPVGSVYWTANAEDDPAVRFGGEWEAVPEMLIYCWTRVG